MVAHHQLKAAQIPSLGAARLLSPFNGLRLVYPEVFLIARGLLWVLENWLDTAIVKSRCSRSTVCSRSHADARKIRPGERLCGVIEFD